MDIDKRINDLKQDFTKIVDLKNENVKMFDTLDLKIRNLKAIYSEYIKNNKNQLFVFGLDSFHFQGKLIDIEYDDMKRLYYAITNRIYCEYFKLYKIVADYITENMVDDKKVLELVKVNNNYPVYKDLEPFKQYDFEIIQNVHETIVGLLNSIYNYLMHKENDLKLHQEKNATGLNIDNFIQTFYYNNVVLREKLMLFIAYIEFFHKLHIKYFKRFTTKMQLFVSQINNDIKFEDSVELNKTKRKSMMENFANENIDKRVLNDLKSSISDGLLKTLDSQPSTPISGMFQSISLKNSVAKTSDLRLEMSENKLLDEGIALEIKETVSVDSDNKDALKQNEQDQDKDKDQGKDFDDCSALTMETGSNKVANEKPKRKYTPRKKNQKINCWNVFKLF